MTTRVLITHAGGRLAIGVGRSLKADGEAVHVVGVDANAYQLQRAVADRRYLVPHADEADYLTVLRRIVEQEEIDVLWPNHEAEIALLSGSGAALGEVGTFLPSPDVVRRCQSKMETYDCLSIAGIPAPRSMLVMDERSLDQAFESFGIPVWVRAIKGAGGKGSRAAADRETARLWIELHKGWGSFMAAECLSPHSVTWESIWDRGQLILAQGRKRLYWEFSSLTPSGVTGVAGAVQWVSDSLVDDVAERTVRAIADQPHGVFSVDITYDFDGNPRVTEVNCGRFMSGGLVHFPQCGYNATTIVAKLATGRPVGFETPVLNPCPQDTIIVHGVDVEPTVTTAKEVGRYEALLDDYRSTPPAPLPGRSDGRAAHRVHDAAVTR